MDTNEGALRSIQEGGRSEMMRREILGLLSEMDLTADEAAVLMSESVLSVRPRFSELHKGGLILDTGSRRSNESGKSAAVWTKGP